MCIDLNFKEICNKVFKDPLALVKTYNNSTCAIEYMYNNHIENTSYKKTIYDISLIFKDLNNEELKILFDYYKYITYNKELTLKLYNEIKEANPHNYFKLFIDKLKYISNNEKLKYVQMSYKLDCYIGCYSDKYISYLKRIMIDDYIDIDTIEAVIPSSTLVNKDEKQVSMINYFEELKLVPLSYKLTYKYALGEDILNVPLSYKTYDGKVDATFTIDEFIHTKTIKK